ncbi:MAG TPA: hypothetical protein VH040_16825 [Usitatibacter sp.]|jgi:hypothetical protein|nr:hypothetical protein [Usitatibacter sp.]
MLSREERIEAERRVDHYTRQGDFVVWWLPSWRKITARNPKRAPFTHDPGPLPADAIQVGEYPKGSAVGRVMRDLVRVVSAVNRIGNPGA